jgi:hypothetical protein
MRKLNCLVIAAVLFAALAGCKKAGDQTAGGAAAGPTKEAAVQVLRNFLAAVEAKDYDKAAAMVQTSEQVSRDEISKSLGRMLELNELSARGIDILAERGKWGKLAEVYGAERASRLIARAGVSVDDCYGLNLEEAEAGFYWDGKQFKLVRIDDIGKLR